MALFSTGREGNKSSQILVKRERSQTVSLKFLRILLNKGYGMPINSKTLR